MKYQVLRCGTFGALETEVNEALKEGWIPQGGVSIAPSRFIIKSGRHEDEISRFMVAQAMTKEEVNEAP